MFFCFKIVDFQYLHNDHVIKIYYYYVVHVIMIFHYLKKVINYLEVMWMIG